MLDYLPENVSTIGIAHDNLFTLIYYITVAIFLLVNILIVFFMIRYRRKEGQKAYHFHGSMPVEFTWTLLPTLLFAGLGFYSDDLWTDMKYKSHVPKPDLEVDVMGQQFFWHMRYPGADGILGHRDPMFMAPDNIFGMDSTDPHGKDDIIMMTNFNLPINKTIVVHLSTVDVLHSFFLPNFRIKQDAVPGMWIDVWFNGFKAGKYELACAELCGSGHYSMRGTVTMQSQEDFNKWMDEQIKNKAATLAPAPTAPVATDTAATPSNGGVQTATDTKESGKPNKSAQ